MSGGGGGRREERGLERVGTHGAVVMNSALAGTAWRLATELAGCFEDVGEVAVGQRE